MIAATDTFDSRLAALKRQTVEEWRQMALAAADGSGDPSPLAMLEAAATLGIREPMAAMQADVAAIHEARQLEQLADAAERKIRERLAEWGGSEGVRQRIKSLERELAMLRPWVGAEVFRGVGMISGQANDIRRKHRRVWPEGSKPRPAIGKPERAAKRQRVVTK